MEENKPKPENIRLAVLSVYKQIRDAEDQLKALREMCPHENQSEGNYSWRIGAIDRAMICDDCGQMIQFTGTTFNSEIH